MPPVDRYRPPVGPPAEEAHPAPDPAAIAAGLAMVAVAPTLAAVLRLFPPLIPGEHGVGWLLPVGGGVTSLALAVGMLLCVDRGLRGGSPADLLRSAALGIVAAGLAVTTLRSAASGLSLREAGFPDGGLAVAALAGAVLLLVAQLGGTSVRPPLRRSPALWLLLFGLIELGLAAAVLLPPAEGAWPWLMALAAALVAAGAVPGPWLAAALTAAGLVALAAARVGSLETLPGLAALAAGGIAYGWQRPSARAPVSGAGDVEAAAAEPPTDFAAERRALAAEEETMRLARELRGTIEELLHARRTIELQREEIAQAATVDALTGVATRRAILERLRMEAAEARRYQHPFAAVLLDLDGFTQLNHVRGMRTADAVLREVALRLRLRVRAADALGRVGADSFLAILPHTDETGAATLADALRRLLTGRPIETEDGELGIGVSIGVAFMRAGAGLSDEELLASADEALASARAAGGNRIAFDRAHGLVRLEERRPPSIAPRADEGAV